MGDLSENPLRKLIREMHRRGPIVLLAIAALPLPSTALSAQDLNIVLPVDSIEYLLAYAPLELPDALVGTRFEEDRTQRVDLAFQDGTTIFAKWAAAPRGGGWPGRPRAIRMSDEFNNSPRYEVAAYELQKLFLEEPEFVIPPTVPRVVPFEWYQTQDDRVDPTFRDAASVLVVLQSFVSFTTEEGVFDLDRSLRTRRMPGTGRTRISLLTSSGTATPTPGTCSSPRLARILGSSR